MAGARPQYHRSIAVNTISETHAQVIVATPYPEGAALVVARHASQTGQLQALATTIDFGRLPVTLPSRRARLRTLDQIHPVWLLAPVWEAVHLASRVVARPKLATRLMYRSKVRFDQALARRIKTVEVGSVMGAFAASELSFRAVRARGGRTALHFVNSHPDVHNDYLMRYAGVPSDHHECVPGWVRDRVEAELDLSDLVFVPSRFVAEQLAARGVERGRIRTIPYGVDLQAFMPAERPEAERVVIGYVGQISHRKGILHLIEAAKTLTDLPVEIRLTGPIVSREVLEGLPAGVTYVGSTGRAALPSFLHGLDIFVMPSIEDSYALAVLEAMSTACPVVITENVGAGELVEHGRSGVIVPAGDAAMLAQALRRLVEDPKYRRSLGAAARLAVANTASWAEYSTAVLDELDPARAEAVFRSLD